jgi:chromosomal replication initiation ATPase DnaA
VVSVLKKRLGAMNCTSDHYKIIDIVCEVYGTSYREIVKACRRREYIYPRYACYYFLRKYTNLTTTDIGRLFGKIHSTVVCARKTYDDLLFFDKEILKKHKEIEERLIFRNIPYGIDALIEEYEKF